MKKLVSRCKGHFGAVAAAVVAVLTLGPAAMAADVIPDLGIAWGDIITAGTAAVGVVIAIAIYRMGVRFISSAFQGRT